MRALLLAALLALPLAAQVQQVTDTVQPVNGAAAAALRTTTDNVNVSQAAAPSTGKVLTATDATHATWQTPGAAGGTVTSVSVTTANGVSGSVATATTTPAITLTLGAIVPTTVNGNTFTTGTGTLTLGSVTLNAGAGGTLGSNAFTSTAYLPLTGGTLTGALLWTDNTYDIGASGATRPRTGYFGTSVVAPLFTGALTGNVTGNVSGSSGSTTGNAATVTTNANLTGPITSSGNATSIASQTGTGTKFVVDTSPTLVTPALGVATATSLNGNTFTTGTYTLTGVAGKTLTFNKSITLEGTDSTTMTFPTTSATLARTDAANTFLGTHTGSVNGAVSAPGFTLTGTWYSGGSATTTKPYGLIEPAGTTSTGWSTSGTGLGINAATGFAGNLLDIQLAGAARVSIDNLGSILTSAVTGANITAGGKSIGTVSAKAPLFELANAAGFFGSSASYLGVVIDSTYRFGWNVAGPDTALSRLAAGVIAAGSGAVGSTAGWLRSGGTCVVATDQTNASVTPQTAACYETTSGSVAIAVKAGRSYNGTCTLFLSDSTAADGASIDFDSSTATATTFRAATKIFGATVAEDAYAQTTALATDVVSGATLTGASSFEVAFFLKVNAAGTWQPRFFQSAHSTGTLTLAAGSQCTLTDSTP